jgi:hypothetical protein
MPSPFDRAFRRLSALTDYETMASVPYHERTYGHGPTTGLGGCALLWSACDDPIDVRRTDAGLLDHSLRHGVNGAPYFPWRARAQDQEASARFWPSLEPGARPRPLGDLQFGHGPSWARVRVSDPWPEEAFAYVQFHWHGGL